MTLHRIGVFAAVATMAAAFLAGARALHGPPSPRHVAQLAVGAGEPVISPARLNLDSLTRSAARRDPFRVARTAAAVPYGSPDVPLAAPAARPPRPVPVLVGIVGGSEPTALLDGLPGTDGTRALRMGERMGDFMLRQVAADHVVIETPDSTWTLRLRTTFP